MKMPPAVTVSTANPQSFARFFSRLFVPSGKSHKGQNGKVLVIGGSTLFHSAVVWPAEVASHFADMVHVSSVEENNDIIRAMKTQWKNGIVVSQKDIESYISEDDVILMGNGMMRSKDGNRPLGIRHSLISALQETDEGQRTYYLSEYLLAKYPDKKWVLDAGVLQMMDAHRLTGLKTKAIVTPHQKEFESLFGTPIFQMDEGEKVRFAAEMAHRYRTVILLKSVYDIVTDGHRSFIIRGGNAGLTRGGTGDILAGLTAAFYAKNEAVESAVAASVLIKTAAEELARSMGIWYNNTDLLAQLPRVMNRLMGQHNKAYREATLVDTKG